MVSGEVLLDEIWISGMCDDDSGKCTHVLDDM